MNRQQSDSPAPRVPGPLKAVFFDLAGTLIRVRGGLGHQYAEVAGQFGVRADPRAIDAVFGDAFRAAGQMQPENERGFWEEVVRGVYSRIGVGMASSIFDRYFDRLFDHFAGAAAWELYPDVEPALERLSGAGLVLGLVTNFDRRAVRLLPALGLDRFLATLAIPAHAGAAKPDRAIFEYALARHGLRPQEAVQVGDSLEDDVVGARAAGLEAVLLDRRGRHAGLEPQPIRSLEELPRLLGLERRGLA